MRVKKSYLGIIAIAVVMSLAMFVPIVSHGAESTTVSVSTADEFITATENPDVTQINLTQDIDLTSAGVLDVSDKIIDLGGNTISAENFTLIFEGSDFTIQNGTFDALGGSYALWIGDDVTENVLVKNITTIGGINVYNASNVVLQDVNATGTSYYVIWCDEAGQVKIEGGTYTAVEGNKALIGMADPDSDNSLEITGGTFNTNGKDLVLESDAANYGDPVITGGIFDTNPIAYVPSSETVVSYADNGDKAYAIGDSITEALANSKEETTVTVIQGTSVTVPDGVTVENETGNDVAVNGETVPTGESTEVHNFVWIIDKEPTATEHGSKHEECTVCGIKNAEVAIPATGATSDSDKTDTTDKTTTDKTESTSPKTGDNTSIALLLALLGVSALGVGVTTVYSRRK